MTRRRRVARNAQAVENAWRLHEAQSDWTGKVDAKASFSFGIQSAIIAAVVALIADEKLFSDFGGWWIAIFIAAILCLCVGALTAAIVVAPLLRSQSLKRESRKDFIYFGHLRHLTSRDLEIRLRERDILPALSRQIVRMAEISWKKHMRVKWSIWLGVLGGGLLVACGFLLKFGLTG